jgi:hypothetical protein
MQLGRRKINESESDVQGSIAEYIHKVPSFCMKTSARVSQILRHYWLDHMIAAATEAKA